MLKMAMLLKFLTKEEDVVVEDFVEKRMLLKMLLLKMLLLKMWLKMLKRRERIRLFPRCRQFQVIAIFRPYNPSLLNLLRSSLEIVGGEGKLSACIHIDIHGVKVSVTVFGTVFP